jgi:hypothetical protein
MTMMRRSVFVLFAWPLCAVPLAAAPARSPVVTLVYTTAETSTSAAVVWNTDVASDSLLQYSTRSPVPADAPRMYLATPVTVHSFDLQGLTPATRYHFKATSCAKRRCATATGTFDTYPSCPDEVPPVSGSWQRVPSPNVGGATLLTNQLLAITSISEHDVWAVGWSQAPDRPPYVRNTLIEHFDGSAWTIVPSPNRPGHDFNVLHAVSGTSASDVWAVGVSHGGLLPSRTLIQHWDGIQWRIVPSPSPDDQLNELRGVAAIAPDDVWAVGYRSGTQTREPIETLVLHWDGIAWTRVASPNLSGGANQLFGIAALSPDDIWAVGSGAGGALAMRWDGSAWGLVPVPPDTGLSSEFLNGVAGRATNDVWAVGQGRGFFVNQPFATIRYWNGVHWTDKVCYARSTSNPPPDHEGGGPGAYLTGVSAANGHSVWAVGVAGSGPLIRHHDDAAWTSVIHPRAFPSSAWLWGVTTSAGGTAWAVGGERVAHPDGSFDPEQTLFYRYSP